MDALEPKDKDRLYTGWPLIDQNVPIGRAHVRYCAICGATNHGKTPAAFSWAYNMAQQGANVLYVTLESPPKVFWIRAFFRYQADHWKEWGHLGHPPTQHRWFSDPGSVTPEWKEAIDQVAQDIRTGTAMKGTMDFQVLLTYDEMVMHIETTRPDVVFIDFRTCSTRRSPARAIPASTKPTSTNTFGNCGILRSHSMRARAS